jgi:hypothetical protein
MVTLSQSLIFLELAAVPAPKISKVPDVNVPYPIFPALTSFPATPCPNSRTFAAVIPTPPATCNLLGWSSGTDTYIPSGLYSHSFSIIGIEHHIRIIIVRNECLSAAIDSYVEPVRSHGSKRFSWSFSQDPLLLARWYCSRSAEVLSCS